MSVTYSKEQLVATLRSTFIGNSESLKKTTDYLSQASRKTGFCMAMMQTVDDNTLSVQIKQAALIQLKNTIKIRWQTKREQLQKTEKQSIKGALVFAVMRCHKNHKLIKLYKEIFTIITGYEYRQWLPVRQIVDLLHHFFFEQKLLFHRDLTFKHQKTELASNFIVNLFDFLFDNQKFSSNTRFYEYF